MADKDHQFFFKNYLYNTDTEVFNMLFLLIIVK